ncbi:MAG: AAA family ATPase [Gemmatimonadales bacterium]|nr:AAA family ATPase [Gemmatimonadales bacterium]
MTQAVPPALAIPVADGAPRAALTLLGRLALAGADGVSGKPLGMLAYLACQPARRAPRERLVTLLWGDRDPARGRHSLRQALQIVRSRLGRDAIDADDEQVTLAPWLPADRDRFLHAMQRRQFADAVAAYGGAFVPDFSSPGAGDFERWCDGERLRLEESFLMALEAEVQRQLDIGASDRATALARAAIGLVPQRVEPHAALLRALLDQGQSAEARLAALDLRAWLAEEEEPVTPELAALLEAAERPVAVAQAAAPAETGQGLRVDLVGREREFAELQRAWRLAAKGRHGLVTLTAPPGLGKTRLLDEFARRLHAERVAPLLLNGHEGDRAVSGAFAADLALALAGRPGARGIAEGSARVLCGLAPALTAVFGTAVLPVPEADLARQRALALADLLDAVAFEQPVVLLLDDLQWADADSLALLAAAVRRVRATAPLCVIAASRMPVPDLGLAPLAALTLPPFAPDDVLALLVGVAPIDGDWAARLGAELHAASEGSPLRLLELLQHALGAGLLTATPQWDTPDMAALFTLLRAEAPTRHRVASLDAGARRVAVLLAIAGIELRESTLAAAAGLGPEALAATLRELEARGLAQAAFGGWRLAHAELAADVLAAADAEPRALQAVLGRALAAPGSGETHERLGVRLLVTAGELAAARGAFVRGWRQRRAAGERVEPEALARSWLGDGSAAAELARGIGSLERLPRQWVVGIGAAAALLAAVMGIRWWLGRPVELVFVREPIAAGTAFVPPPVLEVRDRLGRPVRDHVGNVVLRLPADAPPLRGDSIVQVRDGQARFLGLQLLGSYPQGMTLRFEAPGLRPAVKALGMGGRHGGWGSSLFLERAVLEGQVLDRQHNVLRVARGSAIVGSVTLRYSVDFVAAAIMIGMSPTWGDRARDMVVLGPLPTPVEEDLHSYPIELAAPMEPGTYNIIFAFGAEDRTSNVFSQTNWSIGRDIWRDGNDLVDMTEAQLRQADSLGQVPLWPYLDSASSYGVRNGPPRTWRHHQPLARIKVIVE